MVKTLGLVAVAAVAALVLGFGSNLGTATPKAHADTTGVAVIGCEFLIDAVDGNASGIAPTVTAGDIAAACGTAPLPPTAGVGLPSIANLAKAIGNEDGKLTLSDFSSSPDQNLDANQISTACTAPGLYCTLDVFVFVNDESPVTIDVPSGLKTIEGAAAIPATIDAVCNTDGVTLTTDNDCSGLVPGNGDGVVLFHVLRDTAAAGDVKTVTVSQETVDQSFDVNVVGVANDVKLTLVEKTIETNANAANVTTCTTTTDVTDAIGPPTSTLAYAQVFDSNDTAMTRVPVSFTIAPPEAADIAVFGTNVPASEITGNTLISVDPKTAGAPTAAYAVVCGGKSTGTATITATISPTIPVAAGGNVITSADDTSTADITVTGIPSAVALTATASSIKCDGTETSTVTAKVTDSKGNNVADGVPVTFSVVALGTANPINTTTKDGMATTTVTPLSNSSAGVTVIVTAGDANVKGTGQSGLIQTSVRVDCALPLVTQPTLAPPPPAVPTARIGVTGPDTGNGGYLGQNGSSAFPMWTLVLLAVGSLTLVAGGAVARRAGK